MRSHILGRNGEGFAREFLLKEGYQLIRCNYRARCGEIDVVAKDNGMLCFIEVKARSGEGQDPFEAVDIRKQRVLIRTAQAYLVECYGTEDINARFDVLAVYESADGTLTGDLLKDAFYIQ